MANNIILITNEERITELVKSKLVLLRGSDVISAAKYDDAFAAIKKNCPKAVIIHEDKDRESTVQLIKDVRKTYKNTDLAILLLVNETDGDFILNAYDMGVNDYITLSSPPYDVVIKTVNGMKLQSISAVGVRNEKILEQLNIIDSVSGLYSAKYAKNVFDNEIVRNYPKNGIFMIISPAENSKAGFSAEKAIKVLKSSTRSEDVITHARATKFYLFLPKTNIDGAIVVVNKIKNALQADFGIKVGMCEVKNKSFAKLEKEAQNALAEAMLSDETYIIPKEKDETLESWLGINEESQKNFRIFKQAFCKKLEGVIAPVFYRLQKAYEEKLFDTKIEQYTDETQSVFHLKNKKQDSTLKIVYPGFTKIVITVTHKGLESPENKEISMPLSKITQSELIKIVEDFILDFKNTAKET